mmetsp:Transcript_6263/g.14442  ORF Transcript_6263/g.14442 Transcript_6263/m.14442 type:complete len:82 (-) Transcript_6263:87-332(-)
MRSKASRPLATVLAASMMSNWRTRAWAGCLCNLPVQVAGADILRRWPVLAPMPLPFACPRSSHVLAEVSFCVVLQGKSFGF